MLLAEEREKALAEVVDAGEVPRSHLGRLDRGRVTLRDMAVAAFVLAALLYGQLNNGDRAHERQGAATVPSR